MHGRAQTYDSLPAIAPAPHERATNMALAAGGITTAVIAFYVGVTDGGVQNAVVFASLGGLLTGLLIKSHLTPAPRARARAPRGRGAFASTEKLKAARLKLITSRASHARVVKEKHELRRRLVNLSAKMEQVALPLYAPRIASIAAALATLDKQIAIAARLRDGYEKSITMIEIELESGAAADRMHEDITPMLMSAVRELKALEASQAELARQLSANVEVELLLRPPRAQAN